MQNKRGRYIYIYNHPKTSLSLLQSLSPLLSFSLFLLCFSSAKKEKKETQFFCFVFSFNVIPPPSPQILNPSCFFYFLPSLFFVFVFVEERKKRKMLVANSFDLWQKDTFFSAAEEVQQSADMYVFFLIY